jgi:hypothetical protein
MTYFVDIFSVDTYEKFSSTTKTEASFQITRKSIIAKIKPGDKLLCYLKGFSCWVGVLEITGPMYEEINNIEIVEKYPLKFPVIPKIWLNKGQLLPIKRPSIWSQLSFTKNIVIGAGGWNASLRGSGTRFSDEDGLRIDELIQAQLINKVPDEIKNEDWDKEKSLIMTVLGQEVAVEIPLEADVELLSLDDSDDAIKAIRTSHKMQAKLADIGVAMGFNVWIPKGDKVSVVALMNSQGVLQSLPFSQLSNAEPTLKTIEQIDVLWFKQNMIVRAFEVEHTTAVYSGILRMADLLALQPNLVTKLHIVAPEERRNKVFQELRRPAFSIFAQGALSTLCTYIPYEEITSLAEHEYLPYLQANFLDSIEEYAGLPA